MDGDDFTRLSKGHAHDSAQRDQQRCRTKPSTLRVEDHDTPVMGIPAIAGGNAALWAERHARHPALLEYERREGKSSPPSIEEDHTPVTRRSFVDAIRGGDLALRPESQARDPPFLDH